MKYIFTLIILTICCFKLPAQVIDKTRLEYDEDLLMASQVGMAVSQDMKYAAFALDNGQIRIMDLRGSKFVKSLRVDFLVLNEIAFTQDGQGLLVIEPKRFRIFDWRKEEVVLSEDSDELIASIGVAKSSEHFAIISGKKIEFWDSKNKSLQATLEYKKPPSSISFHPTDHKVIVNPNYTVFNRKIFEYNYLTGKLITEHKKFYTSFYDDFSTRIFTYRNRPVGSAASVPTFRHASLTNPEDYTELYIYGIVKGKATESYEDLGLHGTVIRAGNKVLGARYYSGFSVFDLDEADKVFTTQTTFKKRSTAASSIRKYKHNPHYRINEETILINAYGDNINQIYSAKQNAIIGYIFVDANGSYAVVSRDGRFDGSEDATEKLYWTTRKKANKTKLASTFSQRFSPGLLKSLIAGNEVITELNLDNEIINLPGLSLLSVSGVNPGKSSIPKFDVRSKNATVRVKVDSNLAELSEIRLFQNNKLVGIKENPEQINSFEVSLTNSFGEENFFYFTGASKNKIDTDKKKFIVRYTGKTDEKPKMFVLTVGVNEYKNPRYNLNYAMADADGFSKSINNGAKGIFEKIQNYEIRNADFTKEYLLNILSEITELANEQDLFVFYYAGHGVMGTGMAGADDFYLIPHDITQLYGRDDLLKEKGISANELREISKNINAQKQLFILDACQSAGALDAMASRGVAEERAIAQLARSTGTFWITAAGSEQFATEFQSLGHGVFTYVLLEGLSGKADGSSPDNRITVREISAYLESQVPELSERYKGKPQYPAGYSFGNDFPIVTY